MWKGHGRSVDGDVEEWLVALRYEWEVRAAIDQGDTGGETRPADRAPGASATSSRRTTGAMGGQVVGTKKRPSDLSARERVARDHAEFFRDSSHTLLCQCDRHTTRKLTSSHDRRDDIRTHPQQCPYRQRHRHQAYVQLHDRPLVQRAHQYRRAVPAMYEACRGSPADVQFRLYLGSEQVSVAISEDGIDKRPRTAGHDAHEDKALQTPTAGSDRSQEEAVLPQSKERRTSKANDMQFREMPVLTLIPSPPTTVCPIAEICGHGLTTTGTPDQWWRFIVPIFLHVGVVHLLVNMVAQMLIGAQIEREIGESLIE